MSHKHFIVHKPFGVVSQFISETKKNSVLGDLFDFPEGTMAIGRLDKDSEGLLLLTTDGKESERIRSKKVEKEYYAQVDGEINAEALEKLQNGVEISLGRGEKYTTLPCKVYKLDNDPGFADRSRKIRDERHGPTSWVSITLTEGKFRQVRKMTAAVGFPTLRLIRIRIGAIQLTDLEVGAVKKVDSFLSK